MNFKQIHFGICITVFWMSCIKSNPLEPLRKSTYYWNFCSSICYVYYDKAALFGITAFKTVMWSGAITAIFLDLTSLMGLSHFGGKHQWHMCTLVGQMAHCWISCCSVYACKQIKSSTGWEVHKSKLLGRVVHETVCKLVWNCHMCQNIT